MAKQEEMISEQENLNTRKEFVLIKSVDLTNNFIFDKQTKW